MIRTGVALLPVVLATMANAAVVRVEGEACGGATTAGRTFSGGQALTLLGDTVRTASWLLEAPAGRYTLWARAPWWSLNSALRWRIDHGPWTAIPQPWGLPVMATVDNYGWDTWGEVELGPGQHRLTIETTAPRRNKPTHALNLDCLVLTSEPFDPNRATVDILTANQSFPAPADHTGEFAWAWDRFDDFEPSILDAIHPYPRPVTEDRRLTVRDGHFVFPDGSRFRIWGVSGPVAPTRPDADYYARRARRLGITLVRLHTLDGELCNPDDGPYVIDPRRLDRLCYFVARLKAQGIYVLIDGLYNWIYPLQGPQPGIPDGVTIATRNRLPFFVDETLQQRNREFLRTLLTHRNPYTGLTLGEDPTVAILTVVNENGLFHWAANNLPRPYKDQLQARYNAWLRERYPDRTALAGAWRGALPADHDPALDNVSLLTVHELSRVVDDPGGLARRADQARFLAEVQNGFFRSVRSFVKDELKLPLLVHGTGWTGAGWLDRVEEFSNVQGLDCSDHHAYWDHPQGGFGAGQPHHGLAMLATLPTGPHEQVTNLLQEFAGRRAAGVPFLGTEFDTCAPNRFRLEGTLTMACYGALHDWDGLMPYRLDVFDGPDAGGAFAQGDPCKLMQYPLACLAFVRGLILPGETVLRRVYDEQQTFDARLPADEPGLYALVGRCETVFGPGQSVKADLSREVSENGGRVRSTTGQLTWRRDPPALILDAPGMQGFVGQATAQPLATSDATFAIQPDWVSVVLAAVDEQPLATSRRMLLATVGNTRFTGQGEPVAMADPGRDGLPVVEIRQQGRLPVMMKAVVGTVTLAVPAREVWVLDPFGHRLVPVVLEHGGTRFRVAGAAWYEVIR